MPIVRIEFTKHDASGNGKEHPAPEGLIAKGPILPIIVGQAVAPNQTATATPADQSVTALIDTGATDSCIDTQLAKKLALRVIDRCKVGGVAGQKDHDVFLGKLIVADLGLSMSGRLIGVSLGTEVPIILGRDFLSNVVMIYDGTEGRITLAR